MKFLLLPLAMMASALAAGPTVPYGGFTADDCEAENQLVVDATNMCWYHKCVMGEEGKMKLVPRRCGLGTKIAYNFVYGFSNPCTINFNSNIGFSCKRTQESIDGLPPCFQNEEIKCQNNGILVFESNICWCICPESWSGDFDCSKPTISLEQRSSLEPSSSICVNGEPLQDWCKTADGCLNGGTCYNQCNSFWCDCPNHENNDYWGKRCEISPESQ